MKNSFNEGKSWIPIFVVLYEILRRSQMLLTFSRDQMIYNVFFLYKHKMTSVKRISKLNLRFSST